MEKSVTGIPFVLKAKKVLYYPPPLLLLCPVLASTAMLDYLYQQLSVVMVKHYNQGRLKEVFILACGPRGTESFMAGRHDMADRAVN